MTEHLTKLPADMAAAFKTMLLLVFETVPLPIFVQLAALMM